MSFIAWLLTITAIYLLFFIITFALATRVQKVADSFMEITIIGGLYALIYMIHYDGIMFRYHAALH
ncbi:hypothetical protein C9J12_28640 [Photobacterium frigidiphilum]|uniref:Uncharacterized protein n=1 Tax=Photobacterium frigidiphilum TaxID=264736 RepID=A0A2T3J656_9GAMM|nr:hypothetical protein [Photobacterium frigidiphilum]PSU42832.1 hypothetical protein C9J12_28640 [Photobacterium frigidiphilum]